MNTDYQISFIDSGPLYLPAGKVVCVGRNYAAHAEELENVIPDEPVLFIKSTTALTDMNEPFSIPGNHGECHYETEIAVLVGERLTRCSEQQAVQAISGIGIALDLTLRDLQNQLKASSLPWAKAKAFDHSCPISSFVATTANMDFADLEFQLLLNDEKVQQANTSEMIWGIPQLLAYISTFFTLLPGDIVLTGTPAGVGPLHAGDRIVAEIIGLLKVETSVADTDLLIG